MTRDRKVFGWTCRPPQVKSECVEPCRWVCDVTSVKFSVFVFGKCPENVTLQSEKGKRKIFTHSLFGGRRYNAVRQTKTMRYVRLPKPSILYGIPKKSASLAISP